MVGNPQEIEEMRSTHKHKNLPEVTLPDSIRYTADLEEAMKEKDMLVLSVPSVFVRSTARRMKEFCPRARSSWMWPRELKRIP